MQVWSECTLNSTSNQFTCSCRDPFVLDCGKCLTLPSKPGDPCDKEHAPCNKIELTTCDSDHPEFFTYCKCNPGYVNIPGGPCQSLPLLPGHPCHPLLTPCSSINNTLCVDSICTCIPPLITDIEHGRCLAIPQKAGEPCHPSLAPCGLVPHSECSFSQTEFLCGCQADFVLNPANGSCLALPIYPGDSCDPHLPLPCTGVPNTICSPRPDSSGYYCKCEEPLVNDPNNRRCLSIPQFPEDSCHPIVASCNAVPHTICSTATADFRCKCVSGYIHDGHGKRCILPPQRPGDPCEPTSAACGSITNTTCQLNQLDQYECRCIQDLITEDGTCFAPPTRPGHRCSFIQSPCQIVVNTTCSLGNPLPHPFCACDAGFFTDFLHEKCVFLPEKPGDLCLPQYSHCDSILNSDCVADDDSSDYFCTCRPDYFHSSRDLCLPLPTLPLDMCEIDSHCNSINGSLCAPIPELGNSRCTCIPGEWDQSLDNSQCIRKADFLNEECESSLQCSRLSNSYCDEASNLCICSVFFVPSATLRHCLPLRDRIGDPCEETVQCQTRIGMEAVCDIIGEVCLCIQGYRPTPDGYRCIEVKHIFNQLRYDLLQTNNCRYLQDELTTTPSTQTTTEEAQTTTELMTITQTTIQMTTIQTTTMQTTTNLWGCQRSEECWIRMGPLSFCDPVSFECFCFRNSTMIGNQCIYGVNIGQPCTNTEDCVAGIGNNTVCDPFSSICVCTPNFVPIGNACVTRTVIGSLCETNEDCQTQVEGPVICHAQLNRCACFPGYIAVSDNQCLSGSSYSAVNPILVILLIVLNIYFNCEI